MASRKTQESLARSVKAKETLTETIERKAVAASAQAGYENRRALTPAGAEHLAMMERLLAEVAGMRAAIVEGFDKLVAHMLDDAVAEAAEPEAGERARAGADVPDPPATDASKKHLEPAHKASLDDVREALNAYTRQHGLAEASKVVQGLGVKRLTELPPERYAEAVEAFK